MVYLPKGNAKRYTYVWIVIAMNIKKDPVIAMNTNESVILSAAKNLKDQILRYAQDDKLNLDEGRLYSFIVVRVRMVILSAAKNFKR